MNKYIVIEEPYRVEIRNKDIPVPKEGEALLKVLYGGICGSDLNSYRGTFAYVTYPRIPGHEFSAEIVEIGKNDSGLKPGMVVTANPYFNCGRCYSCRRSLVNCCTSNQTMGLQREGAFAQYITMPTERIYDGRGLDARTLAMIEPFCISYHGVKRAKLRPGEKVLIIGAGTIGILAAVVAKQAGAEVYVCDVALGKLEYVKRFGVNGIILSSSSEQLQEDSLKITDGNLFDTAIEAVGLPSTFQNCIDVTAFGGKVVVLGVGKMNLDFNYTIIQKKELNIFGSRNALKQDFIELIQLIKSGVVYIDDIITNEYSFEQTALAFDELNRNPGNMLKVMLRF